MAEFQEVMRQWGRYCKGYTENHNDGCIGCPLHLICCSRTNILYQHNPIPADIAQKLGIEPKEG